jgi:hypothetical protein
MFLSSSTMTSGPPERLAGLIIGLDAANTNVAQQPSVQFHQFAPLPPPLAPQRKQAGQIKNDPSERYA